MRFPGVLHCTFRQQVSPYNFARLLDIIDTFKFQVQIESRQQLWEIDPNRTSDASDNYQTMDSSGDHDIRYPVTHFFVEMNQNNAVVQDDVISLCGNVSSLYCIFNIHTLRMRIRIMHLLSGIFGDIKYITLTEALTQIFTLLTLDNLF